MMQYQEDTRPIESWPPTSSDALETLPPDYKSRLKRAKRTAWWVGTVTFFCGVIYFFAVIVPAFGGLFLLVVAGLVVIISIGSLFVVTYPVN